MSQKTSRQGKFGLALKLHFPTEAQAKLVEKSVLPELNASHAKRSSTSLGIKNRIISINIKAQDAVALRASLNGCLNSIILVKEILEV